MKNLLVLCSALLFSILSFAQNQDAAEDEKFLRKIYDHSLTQGDAYENLRYLCKSIGGRLSGSPEADRAVKWGYNLLEKMGVDTVFLQEVLVPHWERGTIEKGSIHLSDSRTMPLQISALGGSIGTPVGGLRAPIIEVQSLDELKDLGKEQIEGKIVFYNRPMDPLFINTFFAYGGCVDQRVSGASEAAPYGAVAVLVRSMNLRDDDLPHTGVMRYKEGVRQIPAVAISTIGANQLELLMQKSPKLEVEIELNCQNHADKISYNVIGDIKGSENPDNIIIVSGHLDSWDISEGAHDDGAGVVQSIEVLNSLMKCGYEPKNTIRCVLWMNEENGAMGARKYAGKAAESNENHILAIESDRGGFTPRGFTVDGTEKVKDRMMSTLLSWASLLKPYDLHYFEFGYSGVDINFLKETDAALVGFVPDSQRYFDHHHAENDVFEAVNKRELELGGAAMTSLVYLFDKYGLIQAE